MFVLYYLFYLDPTSFENISLFRLTFRLCPAPQHYIIHHIRTRMYLSISVLYVYLNFFQPDYYNYYYCLRICSRCLVKSYLFIKSYPPLRRPAGRRCCVINFSPNFNNHCTYNILSRTLYNNARDVGVSYS